MPPAHDRIDRRSLLRLPADRLVGAAREPEHGSPEGTGPVHAPAIYVIAYGPHEITEFQLDELSLLSSIRGRYPVVWLNVDGNLHRPTLDRLAHAFRLHPLALQDVMAVGRQGDVRLYQDHLLAVGNRVRRAPGLEVEQVSILAGTDYVVTIQERPGDSLEPIRARLRRGGGELRRSGPDYLLATLLGEMIDDCFPVLDHYGSWLQAMEAELPRLRGQRVTARLHEIRRDLLVLGEAINPMRAGLGSLSRERPQALVGEGAAASLHATGDRAVQLTHRVDAYRELAASLASVHLAGVGGRTSEMIRVLTLFTALFLPAAFILGLYGMSLATPPWWLRGLTVAEVVMLALTLSVLGCFWGRGWMRSER